MLNQVFMALEEGCPLINEARDMLLKDALKDTLDHADFDRISQELGEFVRKRFESATTPQAVKSAAEGVVSLLEQPLKNIPGAASNVSDWAEAVWTADSRAIGGLGEPVPAS